MSPQVLAGDRTEDELWDLFWSEPSPSARNDLLIRYLPLVKGVVSRLPGEVRSHWEPDDLLSFGVIGLVGAIERWQVCSPSDRFPNYAKARVRGAIYDELRRLDWLPRIVRRQVIAYRSTEESLSSELGRTPDPHEVLSSMGIDARGGRAVLERVQNAQLLHLDQPFASDDSENGVGNLMANGDDADPSARLLADEDRVAIHRAVTALPPRQREIIALHLLQGLTQQDIGDRLGVSNSRVCQIEAAALQSLRRTLSTTRKSVCAS